MQQSPQEIAQSKLIDLDMGIEALQKRLSDPAEPKFHDMIMMKIMLRQRQALIDTWGKGLAEWYL